MLCIDLHYNKYLCATRKFFVLRKKLQMLNDILENSLLPHPGYFKWNLNLGSITKVQKCQFLHIFATIAIICLFD